MSQITSSQPMEYSPDDSVGSQREPVYFGLTLSAWVKIALVTGLIAAIFWPSLRRLWLKTNPVWGEPNWGHSMVVPIIGLYYLYINRDELLKATVKTAWTGLPILVGGLLLYAYGIWPGQNDFVKDFGLVVTIFGVVLLLCGWGVMKTTWFPIAFLVVAIPWPGLVYSWVAGPLQQLAAIGAVYTLKFTGVEAAYQGTRIVIGGILSEPRMLNVAEACAGLRSLMTFIAVGGAVAFLSNRPLWQKLLISVSAVPIAILCNVARVSGQGLLDYYVSHEWSQGFAHGFAGMVMLIPAFFLIMMVAWILDNVFVEEVDDKHTLVAGARPGGFAVGPGRDEQSASPPPTAMSASPPPLSAKAAQASRRPPLVIERRPRKEGT